MPLCSSCVQYTQTDTVRNYKFTIRSVWQIVKDSFGPYTIGKLYLVSGTLIYITCYSSEGVTAVCRSVRFVRIASAVFGPYTIGKLHLPQQANQTYTSFFKCERQCDPFGAKEIINRRDTATINKPNMHTSFFKHERQYDPFGAKA